MVPGSACEKTFRFLLRQRRRQRSPADHDCQRTGPLRAHHRVHSTTSLSARTVSQSSAVRPQHGAEPHQLLVSAQGLRPDTLVSSRRPCLRRSAVQGSLLVLVLPFIHRTPDAGSIGAAMASDATAEDDDKEEENARSAVDHAEKQRWVRCASCTPILPPLPTGEEAAGPGSVSDVGRTSCSSPSRGRHEVETHQVDVLAPAMLGDLEKVDDTLEPGRACELGSDVAKADEEDRNRPRSRPLPSGNACRPDVGDAARCGYCT